MKKQLKKILREALKLRGYSIKKNNQIPLLHENPFIAASSIISKEAPVVLDIGVNHGQTLKKNKGCISTSGYSWV